MGLAEPRKRLKLSHDPNNTKWTSDTQSFGHKIMTSQGWMPGQYLGAVDAPHAEFHTAANASHIRVSVKDDNLGLGAKIGSGVGHGECTGLDVFQDLLGRLNGRDEDEIEKERANREVLKRAIYTKRKWESVRFIPGGLLIGDKIQDLIEGEKERLKKLAEGSSLSSDSDSPSEEEKIAEVETKKLKKKRKRDEEAAKPELVAVKVKKSKKKLKSETNLENIEKAACVKPKKKPKKDRAHVISEDVEAEETIDELETKKRKREKKEKTKSEANGDTPKESKKKSKRDKSKTCSEDIFESSTKASTPIGTPSSGHSTPMIQGRHAVRARNIAQKRLASMDVASLNQIFMIKS